jgi:hypothetical protein
MNLPVPRAAILALSLMYSCSAAAAKPGALVDLGDVHLDLVSRIDGSKLPITWPETWNGASWTLGAEVRSGERIGERHGYQPQADYAHDLPTRIGASLDNSTATATMTQLFDDVHVATALGPFPEDHSAAASAGWDARFYLPPHSELTMRGHVTIGTEGDPENGFANFSSGFYSSVYLLPSVVFALERVDQADQDFTITAVNPYDQPLMWIQTMSLDVFSVAPASRSPNRRRRPCWRWDCWPAGVAVAGERGQLDGALPQPRMRLSGRLLRSGARNSRRGTPSNGESRSRR